MRGRRTASLLLSAGALLGGCSIEHSKALGDVCLQDRECVTPLVCSPSAGGAFRCGAIPEAGVPNASDASSSDAATGDAGANDAGDAGDAEPQSD